MFAYFVLVIACLTTVFAYPSIIQRSWNTILDDTNPVFLEALSSMQLSIDMVNSHSDGWYDDLDRVHIIYNVTKHLCTIQSGCEAIQNLSLWVQSTG